MQHGHVQQQQSPSLSHSRDFSHCQSNRMLQIIAGHLPERPKGKQFFALIYFTAKGSNSRNKRKWRRLTQEGSRDTLLGLKNGIPLTGPFCQPIDMKHWNWIYFDIISHCIQFQLHGFTNATHIWNWTKSVETIYWHFSVNNTPLKSIKLNFSTKPKKLVHQQHNYEQKKKKEKKWEKEAAALSVWAITKTIGAPLIII